MSGCCRIFSVGWRVLSLQISAICLLFFRHRLQCLGFLNLLSGPLSPFLICLLGCPCTIPTWASIGEPATTNWFAVLLLACGVGAVVCGILNVRWLVVFIVYANALFVLACVPMWTLIVLWGQRLAEEVTIVTICLHDRSRGRGKQILLEL